MSANTSTASAATTTNAGVAILVARVFLSILFILAGFSKLTAIAGTAGWFGSIGLPMPTATAVLVGLVELLGGLAILVGFQTRIAAIAVAHLDFSQAGNALMLQKNLGLAGGFILLAVLGAGALSLDGRRAA